MKRLVLRLIPLVLLNLKLSESVTKLDSVIETVRHNQCIKVASFLKNVFASNNVTQDGIVNVAIADYSLEIWDTNCIIQKLQDADDRIVFYGATDRRHIHSGITADYYVFFEEFSENVSTYLIPLPARGCGIRAE